MKTKNILLHLLILLSSFALKSSCFPSCFSRSLDYIRIYQSIDIKRSIKDGNLKKLKKLARGNESLKMALHWAIYYKKENIIEDLLNKGAQATSDNVVFAATKNLKKEIFERLFYNYNDNNKEIIKIFDRSLNPLSSYSLSRILEFANENNLYKIEDNIIDYIKLNNLDNYIEQLFLITSNVQIKKKLISIIELKKFHGLKNLHHILFYRGITENIILEHALDKYVFYAKNDINYIFTLEHVTPKSNGLFSISNSTTLLCVSIKLNKPDIVKLLLKYGARTDRRDHSYETAYFMAIKSKIEEFTKIMNDALKIEQYISSKTYLNIQRLLEAKQRILELINEADFLNSWQMGKITIEAFEELDRLSKSSIKKEELSKFYSNTRIIILTLAKRIAQEIFYKFRKDKNSNEIINFKSENIELAEELTIEIILNSISVVRHYLDKEILLKNGSTETFKNLILYELNKLQTS